MRVVKSPLRANPREVREGTSAVGQAVGQASSPKVHPTSIGIKSIGIKSGSNQVTAHLFFLFFFFFFFLFFFLKFIIQRSESSHSTS